MATISYPHIAPADLLREEELSASRELDWLLQSLTETLTSLRSGLTECTTLLSPTTTSTLALSSIRSEALKGYVTRVGNRIVKGDMQVKLFGLPNTKGLQSHKLTVLPPGTGVDRALMLEQLTDVKNFVRESLILLGEEGKEEAWLGRGKDDAARAMRRLGMLQENIKAARAALKGTGRQRLFPYHAIDPRIFDPPLHPHLSFDLYISEAALTAELRTLEPIPPFDAPKPVFSLSALSADTPGGFGQRFAAAVGLRGGPGGSGEGGQGEVYSYRGMDVRVRERVKVESPDPNMMAVWAKLGGLEHALGLAIKSLGMVSGAAGVEGYWPSGGLFDFRTC